MDSLRSRPAAAIITGGIVVLALATGYIHFTLGSTSSMLGLIFLANAAGYATLAGAVAITAIVSAPIVRRFSWAPRVALASFAAVTIVGYLVMGPYSSLGWLTKAIEVVLIGLLVVDVIRLYGGASGLLRAAVASIPGRANGDSTAA